MNEEIRQAADAAKDPASYDLITYAWVVSLSAWGGAVRFIRKVKAGEMSPKTAMKSLIGEVLTSAFAGVVTFYAAQATGVSPLWTAVLVGISGHMGGRAIELFEIFFKRWVGAANEAADKDKP
ncbi:phage holin family protein [Paraburkholderia hospita]|uniref:phage holin family protein n=1 Tax=Paraburkholderia hospita TaxID=169430 RepID=UPI0008A755F8|nr:phage holin family protein [Paraburkholderia hospita]SEH89979.1 LydA holin phage, holin superfamily III [Paraburkholderia hospita]